MVDPGIGVPVLMGSTRMCHAMLTADIACDADVA
jgi:hypothetical protein